MLGIFKKKQEPICENISVYFSLEAEDKWQAIDKLGEFLAKENGIDDELVLIEEIVEREKLMSTGFELGIAIPHAKVNCVDKSIMAIATSEQGIDFDSLDKNPSHIIVMVVSPNDKLEEHVQLMAKITKVLSQKDVRNKILNTHNKDEIVQLFASTEKE